MKSHRISVTVGTDSIKVDPDTLVMTSQDEVQWAATNSRDFSIVFDDHPLFGQRELSPAVAKSRQRPRVKGRFKYTVIASDDENLQLDPVIIIEDPPTITKP